MDIQEFLMTALREDLIFLVLAVGVVMLMGFPVASKIMARGHDLKKILFEDDNPVAGLEIGGMFLALLYLSHSAIAGESTEQSMSTELLGSGLTLLASIVLMVIARGVLNRMVRSFNGDADLNDEIFNQRNIAAAAVSISLTLCIVNGLAQEDIMGPSPVFSTVLAGSVLLSGLVSILLYRFTHLKGASFMEKFFKEDMGAAGVSLLGFVYATNILSFHVSQYVQTFDPVVSDGTISYGGAAGAVIGLSIFFTLLIALLRIIFLFVINKLLGTNLNDELYQQNNLGAGFIDSALCVGSALLLVGAFVTQ